MAMYANTWVPWPPNLGIAGPTSVPCLSGKQKGGCVAAPSDRHYQDQRHCCLKRVAPLPADWSKVDNAEPGRVSHSIGATDCVELLEQRADMEFRGVRRDSKAARDELVRGSLGQKGENL